MTLDSWSAQVILINSQGVVPTTVQVSTPEDIVTHFKDYTVAITTSTLKTGVSLSGHFDYVLAACGRRPLTFPAFSQLSSLVRDPIGTLVFVELGELFSVPQTTNRNRTFCPYRKESDDDAICCIHTLLTRTSNILANEVADM